MRYAIAITAHTPGHRPDTHTIHVDTDRGGYYLTDPTGNFLEVCPVAGLLSLYPLVNIKQVVIEETS